MAEFVTVMSEFMRLCESFKHCEDCPVNQAGFSCDCDHQGYSKTGAEELEHIIMTWAAEHPEPVYPTWGEWLLKQGVIRAGTESRNGFTYQTVTDKLFAQIDADIAEKLGLSRRENRDDEN